MRQIIHRRELREDDAFYADEAPRAGARRVVAAAEFVQASAKGEAVGDAVLIGPTDEVEQLAPVVSRLSLIVIDFPTIGEGRGFSQARLLRRRYGFGGDLRARGALKRDQLVFLARCGFDSFQLDGSENLEQALSAFDTFSVAYQGGSDDVVQIKRRDSGLSTA
jgi:uncharacterized protein (DUF934 family)